MPAVTRDPDWDKTPRPRPAQPQPLGLPASQPAPSYDPSQYTDIGGPRTGIPNRDLPTMLKFVDDFTKNNMFDAATPFIPPTLGTKNRAPIVGQ